MSPTLEKVLLESLGDRNPASLPQLEKIVVNVGVGDASGDKKLLGPVVEHLEIITGQKPVITKSRKAIANFKLREDVPIGAMVTLRGSRMSAFLDRLIRVVIPRIRDFRGLPRRLDGRGNMTIPLREQSVFPEIPFDKVGNRPRGFSITLVTTAKNDVEGFALLTALGVPFKE
ncbi:50S ribosomal protein L5 [bacterium]|nr:50S ribosomal protein L5 [bacterium]